MSKIIISYRRVDSQDIAMRIRDRLAPRYGEESIFTDIDSIPIGSDFLKHINNELATCDALLAIVGPRWLDGGHEAGRGLTEETDYVRIEVEAALKRDIAVVPVVVGGARMPKLAELPEELRAFAFRNAAFVDSGVNFQHDIDRLIRSLDQQLAVGKATAAEIDATARDQPPVTAPEPKTSQAKSSEPKSLEAKSSEPQTLL
jgi:hypothetical protein